MSNVALKNRLQKFENENKNAGVCCINTKLGEIDLIYGKSKITNKAIDLVKRNDGFKSINSQINSFFKKGDLPEFISIKSKGGNRYIKFIDDEKIVFAIIEGSNVNYVKVKLLL